MRIYVYITLAIMLIACDSNENTEPPAPVEKATVNIYYTVSERGEDKFPDTKSLVHVYYNIDERLYSHNMNKHSVALNGIIINYDGFEILPDATYEVDSDGSSTFELKKRDKTITIVTSSYYYKRSSIARFPSQSIIDYTITYQKMPN